MPHTRTGICIYVYRMGEEIIRERGYIHRRGTLVHTDTRDDTPIWEKETRASGERAGSRMLQRYLGAFAILALRAPLGLRAENARATEGRRMRHSRSRRAERREESLGARLEWNYRNCD